MKIEEKIENKKRIMNAANRVANKFLLYAPNVFINILMVGALVVISMVSRNQKFEWEYIANLMFFLTYFTLVIIYVITHYSSFKIKIKKLKNDKEINEMLLDNEEKIEEVTQTISWQKFRREFILERNEQQKIDAWKIYIQNKITSLTTKAKKKDTDLENEKITVFQRENLNDEQIKTIEQDIRTRQDKNRYIKRKRAFEEMLTIKWIAENIKSINLPYNEIDINFIETGNMLKSQRRDKIDKKGKYLKDNWFSRTIMSLIILVLSIFTANLILDWTWGGAVDFLFRIGAFFYNLFAGLDYGEDFYTETDIANSYNRVKISNEFKVWFKNKTKEEVL